MAETCRKFDQDFKEVRSRLVTLGQREVLAAVWVAALFQISSFRFSGGFADPRRSIARR